MGFDEFRLNEFEGFLGDHVIVWTAFHTQGPLDFKCIHDFIDQTILEFITSIGMK